MRYPNIDPIIFSIGSLDVRWYGLAYVAGIFGAWHLGRYYITRFAFPFTRQQFDDFITWAILGVVLGGRCGFVLFYKPLQYLNDPLSALRLWDGGMSFHGGLLGVILAAYFFCRHHKIPLITLLDLLAPIAPIGFFFGRLANFVNGELYGRVTDSPLGMIFPRGGPLPRHPSQLYEAALEGLVLFLVINVLLFTTKRPRGLLMGAGLAGYGLARFTVEFFREPDFYKGFYLDFLTFGQLLTLPMIVVGIIFMVRARRSS